MDLSDATLRALAARPEVVAEFPELKKALNSRSGCSSCRQSKRDRDMVMLKVAIAHMPQFRTDKLKTFLGAKALTITYTAGGKNFSKLL